MGQRSRHSRGDRHGVGYAQIEPTSRNRSCVGSCGSRGQHYRSTADGHGDGLRRSALGIVAGTDLQSSGCSYRHGRGLAGIAWPAVAYEGSVLSGLHWMAIPTSSSGRRAASSEGSKFGAMPIIGAVRWMILPTTSPAFHPAVVPDCGFSAFGSSTSTSKT